jgi:hypothetical protein
MKMQHRKIVELSSAEARKRFLKSEVYFNLDSPKYFNFAKILVALKFMAQGQIIVKLAINSMMI